jgi:hypothetical protein
MLVPCLIYSISLDFFLLSYLFSLLNNNFHYYLLLQPVNELLYDKSSYNQHQLLSFTSIFLLSSSQYFGVEPNYEISL